MLGKKAYLEQVKDIIYLYIQWIILPHLSQHTQLFFFKKTKEQQHIHLPKPFLMLLLC